MLGSVCALAGVGAREAANAAAPAMVSAKVFFTSCPLGVDGGAANADRVRTLDGDVASLAEEFRPHYDRRC